MQRIRTFIGIPLTGLYGLESWQEALKTKLVDGKVKWNEKHLWHLTLKFIGDLELKDVDALRSSLRKEYDGISDGEIILKGAGVFGQPQTPKVVWAGIETTQWLHELWMKTLQGVSALGLETDNRPFRPHLTIGRVKYLKNTKALLDEVEAVKNMEWGTVPVQYVVLYKSRLTTNGPIYSEIERFTLGNG
ncbi:RNA 2',3'-cyclic phosphodiesterase [Thermophagus sp. OGC60D27]|uniref:RNA 2',3'-cyclic phosphodiesterase n=1 Tax=Thermophagus sp. OGC60D27 TaxID=3458415 RepID=UPI004037DC67